MAKFILQANEHHLSHLIHMYISNVYHYCHLWKGNLRFNGVCCTYLIRDSQRETFIFIVGTKLTGIKSTRGMAESVDCKKLFSLVQKKVKENIFYIWYTCRGNKTMKSKKNTFLNITLTLFTPYSIIVWFLLRNGKY